MLFGTILKLLDVNGTPSVNITLPNTLRVGDRVAVRFRLMRRNAGRTEMLDVIGDVRVVTATVDATGPLLKYLISVENAKGTPPKWRAVKTRPVWRRELALAKSPRQPLESQS